PPLVTPTPVAARPRAVIGAPSLALTGDTVSVRVVGESGVPLAGVSVLVVPPTGAEFEAGPTDSSGVVEVKVSGPGLYLFRPLAGYDALEASMLAVTRPPSLVEEAVGAVQAAAVPLGVDWTQLALIGAAGVALALFALSRKRRGDDDEKRQENIREILQEVRQKRLSEGDDAKGGLE
ncbi:MAG: hypothetical protein NTY90_05520, partial [Candidatus Micrarchaeota archaeon]|nr:hypothetical protein [Candidatus Micrarchaeota archaeon]